MRVGIIGCGHVARVHILSLRQMRNVEIAGVCDADERVAQLTATKYGIRRSYRAAPAMLAELRPDVVHVLTPPGTHRDVSIEAMEAGCHVLVEKPMALDAAAAADMLAVSRHHSRVLSVCHNFLFEPAVREARELVARGAIGNVVGAQAFWGYAQWWLGRYQPGHWVYDLPGGFFHESAPHPIYLQQEFLGRLEVACATAGGTATVLPGVRDGLSVLFEAGRGPGAVTFSLSATPYMRWLAVFGSEATIRIDLANGRVELYRAGKPSSFRDTCGDALTMVSQALRGAVRRRVNFRRPHASSHQIFIERYYASLSEGRPPPVTAEDGLEVVTVLERICDALGSPTSHWPGQ